MIKDIRSDKNELKTANQKKRGIGYWDNFLVAASLIALVLVLVLVMINLVIPEIFHF